MIYFLSLMLIIAISFKKSTSEESVSAPREECMSRLDYDIQLLQKIASLEGKLENLETKLDEHLGEHTILGNKGCPNGWLAYDGSCYLFGSDDMIFTVAEDFCRQRGSHLVHVESFEENSFLKGFIRDQIKGAHFWIGMTDEITEGVWRWHGTDQKVGFFDWGPGEPSYAAEDCALFYAPFSYKWVDGSCSTHSKAVCEQ